MEAMAGLSLVVGLFLIVLAILWLLVPFLIMGTNSRLDKLLNQNARILAIMERGTTHTAPAVLASEGQQRSAFGDRPLPPPK